ncbi:hypothetical protein OB920_11880 [Halobacteria archaeon HArc-gm2]|nr:hypothetical protein [Halobacteria archaeon HArc-gm2]
MSRSDRGRIPFALVGVLLLVTSATIAATSQPRVLPAEPAVSKALDGATADTQTALREAIREASEDAAREPVVERVNTTAGRTLNESVPFRDSLRIRVYLAARDRLQDVERRRGDVRVHASLPPVADATGLRAAKRRVHVERADENGTTLRVRVENVTLTATRNGRVLTEERVSPTLVVGTPVLGMHDRVSAYQRQLDAGVTKPGLDQRLTAQLYALTWARGYAQYGGAPIDNVVTNRYVALATNAGLLDVQRETIGTSDGVGRRTLAVETGKLAGSELLGASGAEAPPVQNALDSPTKPPPNDIQGLEPPGGTRRDDEMPVGVNETADDAFLDVVVDGDVNESIATVYSADVRLVSDVDHVGGDRPAAPESPGANWTLVDDDQAVTTDVEAADVAPPVSTTGWHRLESYGREVDVDRTRVRTWRRGNETRTTATEATETRRVAVAVVGRHTTSERAPGNAVPTVHEHGEGPLDGPNMADVRDEAVDSLVTSRGGTEVVVARAATGTLDTDPVRVEGDRPDGLYRWVYRDLMGLRERVRDVEVRVERGAVGSFEVNPPAMLADRIRGQRAAFVDAPATYDGVATKARIAARVAYLDRVLERLDEQAAERRNRGSRLGESLEERGSGSLSELQAGMDVPRASSPERRPAFEGPAGPVRMRVDSAPSYLTRAEIDSERVPALDGPAHPLVARNVNVVTAPYDDVADTVVDEVIGSGGTVRLATAARTLRAANATLERRNASAVRERRDALRTEVADGNRYVRRGMRLTLAEQGVGDGDAERREIVAHGLSRWDTTAARALALSNGSASPAVAAAAADRESLDETREDRLRLELERRTETALRTDAAKPESEAVNRSRTVTRDVATELTRRIAKNATERGIQRVTNESFDKVPSGLPLAPPFTAWYATTNVWHVTVRGEYARFGIRADRGRPSEPGSDLAYARDGGEVRLDVDDDGEKERLGRATRVDFDVSTTIVVVVPPGKSGVGDRDGNVDERSDGWPESGPS